MSEETATAQTLEEKIAAAFPEAKVSRLPANQDYLVIVPLDKYLPMAQFLRDECGYTHLSSVTATDHPGDPGQIKLVAHLYQVDLEEPNPGVTLKVEGLPRESPRVPSLCGLWATANWLERETYDFFGIIFEGHPNLRRILLPDNWQGGSPLLKDFEDQRPRRPRLIRYR